MSRCGRAVACSGESSASDESLLCRAFQYRIYQSIRLRRHQECPARSRGKSQSESSSVRSGSARDWRIPVNPTPALAQPAHVVRRNLFHWLGSGYFGCCGGIRRTLTARRPADARGVAACRRALARRDLVVDGADERGFAAASAMGPVDVHLHLAAHSGSRCGGSIDGFDTLVAGAAGSNVCICNRLALRLVALLEKINRALLLPHPTGERWKVVPSLTIRPLWMNSRRLKPRGCSSG